ncbi:hypothetical protein [Alicyclobacillus fructus]|uniref:hypothetical protein n=1 Tax=Alicyclobacillus fructus TaxID=2816082 RepID=UPI001F17EDD9|nr:hypothetical protein [Alicyclobacillus fructus]
MNTARPVPNRRKERASGASEVSIYRMDPVEMDRYLREKYGARVFSMPAGKPPVGRDLEVRKRKRKKGTH